MPKNRIPGDLQVWIDARKRFHLSHAHVQMARELGLNPKKFGKLSNHRQEPWKLPLPQFIAHLYRKRFSKDRPDVVVSIEEKARQKAAKKAARREAKRRLEEQTVGIAWYLPEQWDTLREISADKDSIEMTHAEWLVTAENAQAQMAATGANIERVVVDVNELEAWCRARGWSVNGKARSQFVAYLLRRQQRKNEGNENEEGEGGSAFIVHDRAQANEQEPPRPDVDPYAPCPCGSGKKYKWCCRKVHRREPR
jgi:uncharacterized protein YchJ